MNATFKNLLGEATRLTHQGDLAAATRSIRQALGGDAAEEGEPPAPFAFGGPREWSRRGRGDASGGDGTTRADTARPDVARPNTRRSDPAVLEGEWRRTDESPRADAPSGPDAGVAAGRRSGASTATAGTVVRARHDSGAGALDYRLFVPSRAPDAPPPALLVMLHGCTQDAEDFAIGTRMDTLAREHGFLVLYPEQSGRANPQRCWNWFKHVHQRRGRGEPGTIEAMVRAIVAEHGVDPARVFVAGLSAGGAMAAILGDVCPELFAAVGVHSGLAPGSASDLSGALAAMRGGTGRGAAIGREVPVRRTEPGPATRQPPTIVFHGDADRTVHPDNGERVVAVCLDGLTASADATRGAGPAAARRTGGDVPRHAADGPERQAGHDEGRGWTREVHRDAAGEVLAEHWRVHGAGHAWSGGNPRGSHVDAAGPDASAEMVRFFLAGAGR